MTEAMSAVLANTSAPGMGEVIGLGMGIVFLGLICIVILLSIMNVIFDKLPKKAPIENKANPAIAAASEEKMDDETVAAVSAAIAETLGRDVSGIRITSIKKIN
ncbi:MAG: OadG family protein [Clostridia bacterium]|nr:OadG family protein [Clostridia bacterium]